MQLHQINHKYCFTQNTNYDVQMCLIVVSIVLRLLVTFLIAVVISATVYEFNADSSTKEKDTGIFFFNVFIYGYVLYSFSAYKLKIILLI